MIDMGLGEKLRQLFDLPEHCRNITIHVDAISAPILKAEFYIDNGKTEQLLATLSKYKLDEVDEL